MTAAVKNNSHWTKPAVSVTRICHPNIPVEISIPPMDVNQVRKRSPALCSYFCPFPLSLACRVPEETSQKAHQKAYLRSFCCFLKFRERKEKKKGFHALHSTNTFAMAILTYLCNSHLLLWHPMTEHPEN